MSALVLGSIPEVVNISSRLEEMGVSIIHFYSDRNTHYIPASAIPFVDMVVLGKGTVMSPYVNDVVDKALSWHIPVVSEDSLMKTDVDLKTIKRALRSF